MSYYRALIGARAATESPSVAAYASIEDVEADYGPRALWEPEFRNLVEVAFCAACNDARRAAARVAIVRIPGDGGGQVCVVAREKPGA